jgi:hypothetical protein
VSAAFKCRPYAFGFKVIRLNVQQCFKPPYNIMLSVQPFEADPIGSLSIAKFWSVPIALEGCTMQRAWSVDAGAVELNSTISPVQAGIRYRHTLHATQFTLFIN